jgi:DNA (cytosine-5)-methyltransferase 1
MKPRLLDLFCVAGGAAMGYHRAGFEVVGVDIAPQPNYPFEFFQADALEFMRYDLENEPIYDAYHASPPCQAYTTMNNRWGSDSPALIAKTRALLQATGSPYVIENVLGALSEMREPYELTGEMFGLRVHRPRLFETSISFLTYPRPPRQKDPVAVYGKLDGRRLWTRRDGSEHRAPKRLEIAAEAMGIDWMSWDEIREAIPPAYTEFIGIQLLAHIRQEAAA